MTLADFEAAGLFRDTRIAEKKVSPQELELLALLQTRRHVKFFDRAVKARLNILISGATGAGKNTLSKGLIQLIPPEERLLTIEDTRDLIVDQKRTAARRVGKESVSTCRSRSMLDHEKKKKYNIHNHHKSNLQSINDNT